MTKKHSKRRQLRNSKKSIRSRRSNSTKKGRRKSRIGDWWGGWHKTTADDILSNSIRYLPQPAKYDGWTWELTLPPPPLFDKPLRSALIHYRTKDKKISLSFWPSDEVREIAITNLYISFPDQKIEHKKIFMAKPYKYIKGRGWKIQK